MQYFLLERALNYFIKQAKADLTALEGKNIHFTLQDLTLTANFICSNNRIFVSQNELKSDVEIALKSQVFLALFAGEDLTELLRQDKIIINGDVKTAQLLVDLFKQIDIDFEEILAEQTGDIFAHQAGKIANKISNKIRADGNQNQPLESVKNAITTLLIAPSEAAVFSNKNP
ncbi:MAG: hypothetical protein HAW58_06185 [Candidatus Thioglobus sp.]|nr:hypothetical protein [Candidatus Thioglobus sp.]